MPLDAWIFGGVRSGRSPARPDGALAGIRPRALVAQLFRALAERHPGVADHVEDVVLGCVTQAGVQGGNIAKASLLEAGWSDQTGGETVNRFCASGLSACARAALAVHGGASGLMVAGGVELCSQQPMLGDGAPPWPGFVHMGVSADLIASARGYERDDLEAYAATSQARAAAARDAGHFAAAVVPIVDDAGGTTLAGETVIRDGQTREALARLSPCYDRFVDDGVRALVAARYPDVALRHVHTVGTSPALADGAALVVIGTRAAGEAAGLTARARILAVAQGAAEPVRMLSGNPAVIQRALASAGVTLDDVDLAEVNESFAAAMLELIEVTALRHDHLNVDGGAIALGHALGATGAILVLTALTALERRDASVGVVSICGGAGVTTAMVIERV